ncbi:hypothetical protein B7R21_14850 [Subtercola boreus]|uniref:Nucleotidyltransferase n=1 Tax=Subtercola boreus TaxID=120213 RepID=A0A3E0VDL7_9MICO|nr:hypothetical protein [Subtercola boreus]RFA07470.1 hypothetical protein B7R21_14850 [Subtercola boreus]
MDGIEEVLERFAAAAGVTADDVRENAAVRDRVAGALVGRGGRSGGPGGSGASPTVLRLVDAGSFRHGTAVRGASRFDAFVVLGGARPKSLGRALASIRSAVQDALPDLVVTATSDSVLVDAPAPAEAPAEGEFEDDSAAPPVRLRLIPAVEAPGDAGSAVVVVPDAARRWVLNRPGAREQLIDRIDDSHLRSLIRLLLVWKHVNRVPVSSYYLETAVVLQALRQPSFNLLWDLCWAFEQLAHDDLVNLPDLSSPSQVQKVRAAETLGRRIEAQGPIDRAAVDARAAVNAYLDDDRAVVDARLAALFGQAFATFDR